MQAQANLTAHLDSCPAPMQPAVITCPAAAPKQAAIVNASFLQEETSLDSCPQGSDCAGEGGPKRLFDCEEGCGFRACGACMEVHESEPHASDSDVMLAMVHNIGGSW
jgi:hypothetical protein